MNESLRVQVRIGQEFKELIDYLESFDKEHRARRLVVLAAMQLHGMKLQECFQGINLSSAISPLKLEEKSSEVQTVEIQPVSVEEKPNKGLTQPEAHYRSAPSWVVVKT